MSEYVNIQPEATDDPDVMHLITNLMLTPQDEPEVYPTPEDGDEGTPLAQTLFGVPGLAALHINGSEMVVQREQDVEWHDLIEDISDALRDFFL
jgi:hypothetical protein